MICICNINAFVVHVVAEFDRQGDGLFGELGSRIREKRFAHYNQLWILETQKGKRDSYDDYTTMIKSNISRSPSHFGGINDLDDESESTLSDHYDTGRDFRALNRNGK